MQLIVGLGNPGAQYAKTRHNVGFRVIDRLAEKVSTSIDRTKFKGEYGTGTRPGGLKKDDEEDDGKLLLLKPQTFMNLSGEAVAAFSGYFKIELPGILVVVDDVALPLGVLRLRRGGSDGGHNGLKDISRALGSQQYARLRLGVGGREEGAERPPADLADHVLSRFSGAEEAMLAKAIDTAADASLYWSEKGVEAAMNRFNTKA
jgi:PTH1 family peptidyl-tRNA hydrolase